MSRYLYLVRHGEQQDAQHGLPDGPLSPRGVRQAEAVAERLSGVPFSGAWTSPLQRAQETARIMAERMPALKPEPSALLMDCVPSGPTPDLPHAWEQFFGAVTEDEISAGQAQMADAVAEWLTPSREDRHDLLITHNFVIGWFVREVFGAAVLALARNRAGELRAHDHPRALGEARGARDAQRPRAPPARAAHRPRGRPALLTLGYVPGLGAGAASRSPALLSSSGAGGAFGDASVRSARPGEADVCRLEDVDHGRGVRRLKALPTAMRVARGSRAVRHASNRRSVERLHGRSTAPSRTSCSRSGSRCTARSRRTGARVEPRRRLQALVGVEHHLGSAELHGRARVRRPARRRHRAPRRVAHVQVLEFCRGRATASGCRRSRPASPSSSAIRKTPAGGVNLAGSGKTVL